MNRKISYEDCIRYIEHDLHIKLLDFQKEIIRCFCEGKEVRTSRCAGRTTCAEAFGRYIANVYDKNDYALEPDAVVPYQTVVRSGLLDEKHIEKSRKYLPQELFEREYCSK